jgi:N-[(2S)-2-amino-2-carboxyethyl]-L-glutamate dehydrogenase
VREGELLIIKGHEVDSLLRGREREIMAAVRHAYEAHRRGEDSLPHSTFLRFPAEPRNRIIALPAYLGADFDVAGVKWVSSFPANTGSGLDRASAVVVLNSTATGRPQAVLEGSVISAKRTAAGAALAAAELRMGRPARSLAAVGCGLINFEIVRFALVALPELESLVLFDKQRAHAERFREKCGESFPGLRVEVAGDVSGALAASPLVSFATTAATPHVADLSPLQRGATVLHISLRDLTPEAVLSCDNVVDDVDHVCRAQTSVHLAEQLTGGRDFIRCTLADVLAGAAPPADGERATVFSPFGLGILDLAVAKLVCESAAREGAGSVLESFLPEQWHERP